MNLLGDLNIVYGRIRGLKSAVNNDEPVRKQEQSVLRRLLILTGVSGAQTCDWSSYDEIRLTTTGAVTLTFSGAVDGQGCILTLKGGNTVALPSNVRYNSLVSAYTPTNGAAAVDKIGFTYDAQDLKYDLVSVVKGIA